MTRLTSRTRALSAIASAVLLAGCGGGGGGSAGTAGGGTVVITAPGAPTGVTATAGIASASIAFTAPASNGGAAITSYTASCTSGATTSASAAASPITVSPLTNGVAYSCTVTATNSVGTGAASAAANVTPTTGAPGAPAITAAAAANASALITFTAPASAGASAITSYTASCSAAGGAARTTTIAGSPVVVLGLQNGVAHSCTVTATNAQGTGAASAAANVTPAASSATPAGVAAATTVDFAAVVSYANILPAYYDATVAPQDNTPNGQVQSDRIATLGRVLFNDRKLSINDAISCSSCHQQAKGFTDPARFSVGFQGTAFTSAHSMRLGNVRYYGPGSMFWDKRAASVEAQATQPIQNAVEMGWDATAGGVPALIAKMTATTYYSDLFNFAFGTPVITEARIQTAIAQFERAMVTTSSKWDVGYATTFDPAAANRGLNTALPNFTAQENRGRQIYMTGPAQGGGGCIACHAPPTFSLAGNSQSNGLDAGQTIVFKSPSLKNLGVTGPYMHDGRFATIEEVVEFYDHGVQAGPALDNRLRANGGGPGNNAPLQLNLSVADKAALAAFLRTLDDTRLNTDPRFSSPMTP